jgi:UDPglucose 6-dehydrogenase
MCAHETLRADLVIQRIAVLGFAFKADTGDTRESASITLIRDFVAERAYVTIYDPKVAEAQIWLDLAEACPNVSIEQRMFSSKASLLLPLTAYTVKKQVTIATTALDACTKAEAIVIATEWKEFRQIDWTAVHEQMNKPAFVFDGRLLVDADELRRIGFTVCSPVH